MRIFILLLILTACSSQTSNKKNLLFIHGSHFDGESWKLVTQELSTKFEIKAPSIRNKSLKDTAKEFCAEAGKDSIIVSHSYGGAIANQMVQLCPDKVKAMIYVTAVVPRNKERAFDLLSEDDQKFYSSAVDFGEKWITPKKDFLKIMAGSEVSESIKVYPEPVTLGSDVLDVDDAALLKVKKAYIHPNKDKIVSYKSQVKFTKRENISQNAFILSGHLPMLTNPKELAINIDEMTRNAW